MKLNDVKVGMLVAVNDVPTGMVYDVDKVEGFTAHLSYKAADGRKLSGGREGIDISCLRKPTAAQLKHNGRA